VYRVLLEEHNELSPEAAIPWQEIEALRPAAEERHKAIQDADDRRRLIESDLTGEVYRRIHATGVKRSAVCFSGGGIRSATFGLGILQGLAHYGLLSQMDYLSTVSGGGYLGSWLSAWIYRERRPADADRDVMTGAEAVRKVETELAAPPCTPLRPEPDPIFHLRTFSRYMSPKLGLLSADTWTLVAIFLRNLLLNWLVLLPLLAAVLMVPRLSMWILDLAPTEPVYHWLVLGVSVLCGIGAIAYVFANLPSARSRLSDRYRGQWWFLWLCLLPLGLMAIGSTIFWAWTRPTAPPGILPFVLFGIVLNVGGFLVSRIWVRSPDLGVFLASLATGTLGGALLRLFAWQLFPRVVLEREVELYVCFAAPLLLWLYLVSATLFVGLASYHMNDGDREWLARSGAWVLIAIFVRSAVSSLVIFGPEVLTSGVSLGIPWLFSVLGGASGLVTLVLGRSAKTAARKKDGEGGSSAADLALKVAAPIFVVIFFSALALATSWLLGWILPVQSRNPTSVLFLADGRTLLGVTAGFLALGGFMGFFIDINLFSLHAAYRDRLIRAYLGASRPHGARKPDPFTGFDERDNVLMRNLRGNRPLHVVNIALNLVAGKNLAWQDRKAESFTVTPLHAGSYPLGYRRAADYGLHRGRGPREKRDAISLGTALAISGAAASPNMGYHSSAVVTFLLALFNVRLGWWLGNPGEHGDNTYDKPGPRFAPRPLISEAFGLTDDHNPYVYLSDGGHFENLGIYEMVLRRCHFIVVSDAESDADFQFEGLASAIGKIRTDLGISIVFDKILMQPRDPAGRSYDLAHGDKPVPYAAIGRIEYTCVDTGPNVEDGYLLYFKASLNGTEPVDVFNYAKTHPGFPHESTADQLYSEAQLESYRALGYHAFTSVTQRLAQGSDFQALFNRVQRGPVGRAPRPRSS
jgi:hypothetical protein